MQPDIYLFVTKALVFVIAMAEDAESRVIGLRQFSKDLVDELSDLKIFQVGHIANERHTKKLFFNLTK